MKNIPKAVKGAFHERQADALFTAFSAGDIVPPVRGKH